MRYAVCLAVLAACRAWAQDLSGAPDGATLPMIVEVPSPPIAVLADGRYRLAYEMHLTNWSSNDMVLTSIVVAPTAESSGFTIEGDALEQSILGSNPNNRDRRHIAPSRRSVVFLFLSGTGLPKQFIHRIRFHSGGKEEELLTGPTPVRANELVIQPPLRGAGWRALNGPDASTHHRRGLLPYAGRAIVPQRWAIDFLQVNEKGETHSGDAKANNSYRCYGAEALAVGAATVLSVKDGIPDNTPTTAHAVPMTWETVGGNQVVLDLGKSRYAFYAHLQPSSIRVKPGDRVKAGQVLGLVGNSGNSTEPHLHFQIGDDRQLMGGDGIPFVIDAFKKEGVEHKNEVPLRDWVVDFR